MDNLAVLLRAAEYVDRRDRELEAAEHTYASTLPMPEDYSRRRSKNNRKTQGSRSTHNESEKNRRAHLRHCMEGLKRLVPVGPDASRHTTLSLLTKAKSHIKSLEVVSRNRDMNRQRLGCKRDHLRQRLQQLVSETDIGLQYRLRVERTISECSNSTSSSSGSNLSLESTESDDVDILGSGSSDTDPDDVTSIRSMSSDSGCHVSERFEEYL